MSEELPDSAVQAFERHDAFEREANGFRLTTSRFGGRVTAVDLGGGVAYTLTVRAPTLETATVNEVGEAVESGWFDTMRRRLADAPKATRSDVSLSGFDLEEDGDEVVVTFQFEWDGADRAAAIAKTFAEYVEGTYVESVVPGYDYEGVVGDMLQGASQGEGGRKGGTPL
ncbi:MAG: hypothetical protein ACI9HI_001096 [Salinirussus sp.]|jgi:hypothetical protein